MSKSGYSVVLLSVLLAACAGHSQRADIASTIPSTVVDATAEQSQEQAANDNLNAVAWTQTAIERDLIYVQAYRAAQEHLSAALNDPQWDALAKAERKTPLKDLHRTAIIVDIDETVLDNSPYQARLVRDGLSYDDDTWAEWCREKKAKPIPGALEFLRHAASQGVTVFYLSNRATDLHDVTLKNLEDVGFPIAKNEQVFLGLGTVVDGCEQKGSEKGCRRSLIERNYRVLMQFGDQIGDFIDVHANTLQARRALVAPYQDWFGQRWFVLPNPTYGSWEPALFNNNWRAPADERRRMKIENLNFAQ
jgi:5'-nucleotidase (lipoprotein e(P4) family)